MRKRRESIRPHHKNPAHFPQIQVVLDREQEIARSALAAGDKRRALVALRQKKSQEAMLARTDGQLRTLQELVSAGEREMRNAKRKAVLPTRKLRAMPHPSRRPTPLRFAQRRQHR
jgi:hypothetical protein